MQLKRKKEYLNTLDENGWTTQSLIDRIPYFYKVQRESPLQGKVNEKELLAFIEDIEAINDDFKKKKSRYRYTFEVKMPDPASTTYNQWRAHATPNMVRKALEMGHKDIEVFFNIKPNFYDYNKTYGNKRANVSVNLFDSDWVLDLDEVPGCDSIPKLIDFFKNKGVIVPAFITQTGPSNFHCFFAGPAKFWRRQKRFDLAHQLAGIGSAISDRLEYERRLSKGAGIDLHYLEVTPKAHKMRVPGSNKCKVRGESFLCKGWRNDGYNRDDPFNPFDPSQRPRRILRSTTAKSYSDEAQDRKIALEVYKRTKGRVHHQLKQVLPRSTVKVFTDIIASNITKLKKDGYALDQVQIAIENDISQPTVSRNIKLLIKEGLLVKCKPHRFFGPAHKDNRTAEYTLGPKLIEALSIGKKKENSNINNILSTLAEDYVRGETYRRLKKDLMLCYSLGISKEDFVELATAKLQYTRYEPWKKQFRIARMWDRWETFFEERVEGTYFRSPEPLIDVQNIINSFYCGE